MVTAGAEAHARAGTDARAEDRGRPGSIPVVPERSALTADGQLGAALQADIAFVLRRQRDRPGRNCGARPWWQRPHAGGGGVTAYVPTEELRLAKKA